jgi:DNA helicase-2/ATP-dependent DNA helicase PcrA
MAPDQVDGRDLAEVHRRPSRGLPQWATKWLERCRSLDDLRRAAARIDDPKVGAKLDDLAGDLDRLAALARRDAPTRDLLTAIRDDIGLGSAMRLLDSSGGATGSHLDDLEALLQVADLHPDAASFEGWLRRALHREHAGDGVTLSTVHRVKGLEWDRVAVFGVSEGIVPHRLADDVEEERRVLHVAITRGRRRVLVLGDDARRSPFLAELDGSAPKGAPRPSARPARTDDDLVAALAASIPQPSPEAAAAAAALRAWRLERSRADKVPAYVVLSDKHLDGIAERHPKDLAELRRCPGIGPAKLDTYGEDILEVLGSVTLT